MAQDNLAGEFTKEEYLLRCGVNIVLINNENEYCQLILEMI